MGRFEFRIPVPASLRLGRRGGSRATELSMRRHRHSHAPGLSGRLLLRPQSSIFSQEFVVPRLQFPTVWHPHGILLPPRFDTHIVDFHYAVPAPPAGLPWPNFDWEQGPNPTVTGNTDTTVTLTDEPLIRTGMVGWFSNFTVTFTTALPGDPDAAPTIGVDLMEIGPVSLQIAIDLEGTPSGGVQISIPSANNIQITGTVQQDSGSIVVQGTY